MADERNIADGGGAGGDDSILVGMLPRVVEVPRNALLHLRALIVVTACMEPPSNVVRYHYSSAPGHHVRWDSWRTKKELIWDLDDSSPLGLPTTWI